MARVMPGREGRGAGRKFHHMHIEPADGGGHIIEHHAEHSPMAMGDEHVIKRHVFGPSDGDEALAHIQKHAKIEPLIENEPEERVTGGPADDEVANPA